MKKTLVAICCVIAMVLAIPFASYAREANDTTLFINSDSTDIYSSSVRKVFDKTFSSADNSVTMAGWNITGSYETTDEGLVLKASTASAISAQDNIGGKFIAKYSVVVPGEAIVSAYFNYKDASNYYSIEVDSYEGIVRLKKVVGSSVTTLVEKNAADLVISSGERKEITLEFAVGNGDNISVWYTVDGNESNFCENVAVSGSKLVSGKLGVEFQFNAKAAVKYIKVYEIPEADISNVSNTVKGKIVCYKDADVGSAVVAVAFYKDGSLIDIFTEDVSVKKGINDFSVDVKSEKNLAGTKIKCFLFDSLSNIKPLVTTDDNSSYRNEGFSDELEPYYPMASAASKSVDDMYALVADRIIIANSNSEEIADRKAVIEMYKNAGFDITADLNDNISSSVLRAHAPQTYSTLTPKPLMGNYEQSYSIDAPWNNPIPKDNPRTEITSWTEETKDSSGNITKVKTIANFQFTAVRPKGTQSGNGLGIPIIIADEDDGFERFAYKYSTNALVTITGVKVRVPENYGDMLNDISTGDRHAVFIDDVSKLGIQTWSTVASNSMRGYELAGGLVKDFDARSGSNTSYLDLTGMGNERRAGVNAAGIPMDAITIKSTDLDDNGEDITHALGAALGTTMRARVYPAYDMDSGIMSNETAVGCIPYGGIIQLDPSIDLEGMYANGKLSLPGYKILKAWRDYGMYNVDQSTSALQRGTMLIYSSATYDDWADDSKKVPYSGRAQDYSAVEAEIKAVLAGDSFFGLSKPVSFYVTTPVVKKTSYDANEDGEVSSADAAWIEVNIGNVISVGNVACDINKDDEITERDADLVNRYLSEQYPHTPKTYAVTTRYSSNTGWKGNVSVSGGGGYANYDGHGTAQANIVSYTHLIPEGEYYSVSAVPSNGYVFDSWVNEELAGETSNVITVKATSDAYYSANFKRAPAVKVVLEKNEDGEGTIGYTDTKSGGYGKRNYGTLSDIRYGNFQCAFNATPAEGYVFESWEVTADGVTKKYYSNILNAYINSDTNIKVNFKKANAYDTFDSLDRTVWTPDVAVGANGFKPEVGRLYASVSGGTFNFTYSALDNIYEYVVINNSVISLGNISLYTTVKALNSVNANRGRVVFGYKDVNNYWYVDFSPQTEEIRLIQKLVENGKATYKTHAKFTSDESYALDFTANAVVHITTTSDGKVTVYVYQGNAVYEVAENVDAGAPITGKMGLGTSYASHIIFDNFAVISK